MTIDMSRESTEIGVLILVSPYLEQLQDYYMKQADFFPLR